MSESAQAWPTLSVTKISGQQAVKAFTPEIH